MRATPLAADPADDNHGLNGAVFSACVFLPGLTLRFRAPAGRVLF